MNESYCLPASDIGPETLAAISLAAEAKEDHSVQRVEFQARRFALLEKQIQSAGLLLVQMLNERAITLPKSTYGWRLPVTGSRGQDVVLTPQGDIVIPQTGLGIPGVVGTLAGIAALGCAIFASTLIGGRPATIGVFLFMLQGLAISLCASALATGTGFLAGYTTWKLLGLKHRHDPTRFATFGPENTKSDLGLSDANAILELTRQNMLNLGVSLPVSLAEAV
jgi:hypothetical protein